ncbi:MAG: response regulator [Bacteroidales bacterium]|nr:response regulator [Bacteroidales bacterium]
MKKYLLSILFIIAALSLEARMPYSNFYFRNINKENGLSQTDIKAIAQTPDGFMWFGTRNKLNRYDGRNIKVFDVHDRDRNIRNNNITALHTTDDNTIFVGTDIGVFILDPKMERFTYIDTAADDGTRMTNWVSDIKADNDGFTWIVLPNQGVFRLSPDGSLHHYLFGMTDEPDNGTAESICIDKTNKVWIGTNGNGLFRYDRANDSFEQFLGDSDGNSLKGDNIYCMADLDNDIVIGSHTGKLRRFNKRRNAVTDFNTPEIHNKIIRDVKCFDDNIWVGTQSGVFIIDVTADNEVTHIFYDPMNSATLSDNQIGKIFRDRENGVWIGTNLGGINYLSPFHNNFLRYVPLSGNSISSKRVRDIAESPDGRIWLATEDAGVSILDPRTGHFDNNSPSLGALNLYDSKTLTLLGRDKEMWVGYFKNGVDVIDYATNRVRHYSASDLGINEESVYALHEDSNNNVWLGNGWSIYNTAGAVGKMTHMPQFGLNYNFDILEDSNHDIWVITMGNGVYRHSPSTGEIRHYTHDSNDPKSLSSNSVSNAIETSRGEIWFSTDRGGICRFNPVDESFTTYSIAEGLPDDTAYKMLEDKNGYLWFGTNNGLVKFSPDSGFVTVYNTGNGLPTNQFSYKGALKASDGRFYFGCSEGLVSFDPNDIQSNTVPPPVYITGLSINNEEVSPNDPDSPLTRSILGTREITLRNNQNIISFEFAALSYIDAASNMYAYRMDNVNNDWVYTTNNRSMTYANLPPGKYTFHVKGANADGVWSDEEQIINITILPPWWRSNIAIIIYIVLFLSMMLLAFYLWRQRMRRKAEDKERQFNHEKEKEIYRSKLDLYVKIAHEIRTPVTLINGPLESLLDMNIADPDISRSLRTIQRSSNELMTITNQLLDFRKLDKNRMELVLGRVEITSLLKEKINEFTPLARNKGIELDCTLPKQGCYVTGDRNGIIKVLNNLLSNAVRYCKSRITVDLQADNGLMTLRVLNDGDVIAPEYQAKIFDAFYQMEKNANVDSSTGIGLNLARSLAELMGGTLTYSIADGLNCFSLKLTLSAESDVPVINPDEEAVVKDADSREETAASEVSSQVILLVEDNEEVRKFLADKLSMHYKVITAANGVEAFEIITAQETAVDMVITDLMMPQMDGMELTQHIRSTIEVSHLPIIILTAKHDLNSRVAGLSEGADAYIEKPFSMKHLLAQIKAIFDKRLRDRQNYSRNPFMTSVSNSGMSNADKALLDKITHSIEENITDPNFGVEMLADQVNLSRSSLHRKLKDLIGTSPTDFVRLIRLKKAADLITEGSYRIGEVCYIVGINSPSYFIKIFQKQFGMTPKEFEKRQREQKKSDEK